MQENAFYEKRGIKRKQEFPISAEMDKRSKKSIPAKKKVPMGQVRMAARRSL